MGVTSEKFIIQSSGFDDAIDITQKIKTIVSNSNPNDGVVIVTSPLPTVSFLRIENTRGLIADIKNILSSIVPVHKIYEHDNNWHDANAFSHLKAMLLNNSLTLAIHNSTLELPVECSVVLIDFNNKMGQIPVVATVISSDKKENNSL